MSRADRECLRWVQSELPRLKRSVRPCHPPRPSSPIAILYPQGGRSTSAMQPKIGLRPFPAPGDERRTLAACRETPRQGDDDGPALALQKRSGRVAEAPVISVIDDDPSVRTATARLLRSMGFSVYAFASAQEFLSSPQLNETSCVIADVQMPGMNSAHTSPDLRKKSQTKASCGKRPGKDMRLSLPIRRGYVPQHSYTTVPARR
jgi:CheY-like chemotaxis protein